MKTIEDAKRVFFALSQNDTRALRFVWHCGDEDEMEEFAPLRLSAELCFCVVDFLLFFPKAGEVRFGLALAFSRHRESACSRSWCGRVACGGGGVNSGVAATS